MRMYAVPTPLPAGLGWKAQHRHAIAHVHVHPGFQSPTGGAGLEGWDTLTTRLRIQSLTFQSPTGGAGLEGDNLYHAGYAP